LASARPTPPIEAPRDVSVAANPSDTRDDVRAREIQCGADRCCCRRSRRILALGERRQLLERVGGPAWSLFDNSASRRSSTRCVMRDGAPAVPGSFVLSRNRTGVVVVRLERRTPWTYLRDSMTTRDVVTMTYSGREEESPPWSVSCSRCRRRCATRASSGIYTLEFCEFCGGCAASGRV
jgi:hypothetical protein